MKKSLKLYFNKASNYLFPLISFIILILLSVGSYIFLKEEIRADSERKFNGEIVLEAQRLTSTIDNILNGYFGILQGASSIFNSSESVTRDEWKIYVEALNLQDDFPALSALEYVKRVDIDDRDSYIKSVRKDDSINDDGYPDFDIETVDGGKEHYIVHYVEPLEKNEAAFGFDLFSNDERKAAIELARDTNSLVITEPITLVQETSEQKSFLILLPVYKQGSDVSTLEGRRKNITGLVLGVIRANDLFSQVVLSSSLVNIESLLVNDISGGGSQVLLPIINKDGSIPTEITQNLNNVQKIRINLGLRTWEAEFLTSLMSEIRGVDLILPWMVLVLGVIISALVGLVMYNSLRLRFRAEKIAKGLTQDLVKFNLAVEGSSDHMIITDPEGVVIYVNPAACRITGYSKEEILGAKPSLWGRMMERDFYKDMWETIKLKKKTYQGQFKNKRKNGEVYDVDAHISPILNDQGEVIYFVAIERDITDEKQLQKFLEQEKMLKEEQSDSMLENIAEGIVVIDEIGQVTHVNPGLISMFGFDFSDFEGKNFEEVIKAYDIKDTKSELINIIGEDKRGSRFLLQDKMGNKKAVSISTSLVKVDEVSKGTVSVIHDFTDDYEIQRKKDEFFAIASHEMKTPLTAISGNISLVLGSKIKFKTGEKEMLSDSLNASKGLIKIVNNLLTVSEIDVGKISIKKVEVDVSDILDKAVNDFSEIAKEKKIKLINNISKEEFKINSDESLLSKIVINLLDNAMKFTKKGSVSIDVEKVENKLLIKFTDTGIGISDDKQKYLFGRFQQAMEDVLARDAGGTGIGLYVSNSLAKVLGGKVYLEKSKLGKGSTFVLELDITKKVEKKKKNNDKKDIKFSVESID